MSSLQSWLVQLYEQLGLTPVAKTTVASTTETQVLPEPETTTQKSIPGMYGLQEYGQDLHIPLVDMTLTGATTFTYSATATVHRTTIHNYLTTGTSVTAHVPLLHSTEQVLSNLDTGLIVHEGDNTAFSQNYLIEADMTAAVHQIQLSFAVAMTVGTWTDANLALDSVSITLSSYMAANQPITQPGTVVLRPSSAFSALGAAGTHLFIVRDFVDIPMKLRVNGPLIATIAINTTGSRGADTYQVGIVDMYPVAKTSAAKRLLPSEIIAHIHPLPEHIDELKKFTDYEIGGVT